MTRFLKRVWKNYSKLGRRKKKKQVWRKPRGRDNKMREKRKGYPAVVKIGYKRKDKERKKIRTVYNAGELDKVKKNELVFVGNVGRRKKIEISKKAKEKNISLQNIKIEKLLKENQKEDKEEKLQNEPK